MTNPDPTQSPAPWSSNASAADIARNLRAFSRVAVLTHAKPDGDALGSSFALARALIDQKVHAECWFVGPCPRWLTDVSADVPWREFAPGTPLSNLPGTLPDAMVVVDTGSWPQLAEAREFLTPLRDRAFLIDHHLRGDPEVADFRLIDTAAASCTQVLAPVCVALLNCVTPARLPENIANALYLGLATDTGWFRFSNVSPSTLRLAADLMEAGVDHTRLYRLIEQQDHAARWQLFGRALRSLAVHNDGRIATMTLSLKDFADTGATPNDTSGFADMVLTIASVELAAVLVESQTPGGIVTKISLRSKPGDHAVDVNALASRLGGGGHARAAGAKVNASPAQALATLLEAAR